VTTAHPGAPTLQDQLNDPEWADSMLGKTLLGRPGRPEEVATVAVFLASG
jgi:NAD(P)-dependent dehydrogenase (short-subunit alcohol dehydrogenase family)